MEDKEISKVVDAYIRARKKHRYSLAIYTLMALFFFSLFAYYSIRKISKLDTEKNLLKNNKSKTKYIKVKEIEVDTVFVYKIQKVFLKDHTPTDKDYCETTLSVLYKQNDSLTTQLTDCKKKSLKTFLKGGYYYHEINGNSDSIDVRKMPIDLLILKNVGKNHLYIEVIQPKNIKVEDIVYSSIDPEKAFSRSDGQVAPEQYVTISVEKLKTLDRNIIIEYTIPSTSEKPPLGQLKLITK